MAAYLDRGGAVALLCTLSLTGSRFAELAEAVDVSRTTLSQRLEEGQGASLITTVEAKDDRRTTYEYALTETGACLRLALNQSGLTTTYRLLRDYRRQFDEQTATVREWVGRNEDEIRAGGDALNPHDCLLEFDALSSTDAR